MKLPFQIDLGGKVAVVTGAGGVLCSDFARAIAQCGESVLLYIDNLNILSCSAHPVTKANNMIKKTALFFIVQYRAGLS